MDTLPEVLITQILSRLPPNDILHCKLVSKPWKTLINSPHFTKLHLNHILKNPLPHFNLIIKGFTSQYQLSNNLYSVDFSTLDRITLINPPLLDPCYGLEIAGSCHGILCISLLDYPDKWVCLFNPLTRTQIILPTCPPNLPSCTSNGDELLFGFGFGYHSQVDDYKVVRISQFPGANVSSNEVMIYSVKSHSWKKGKDIPYLLRYKFCYAFLVKGILHWLLMDTPEPGKVPLVVGYDLDTEKHHLVPHPDYGDEFDTLIISDFDGYICASCNYTALKSDIWVMKEYMVRESWVKMFTIRQDELVWPRNISRMRYVRPVGCLRNGKNVLLLKDATSLVMYSLERKSGIIVNVVGMEDGLFDVTVCLRSLVSMEGGGGIVNKVKIEGAKKKKPQKKGDDFLLIGFKLKL